MTKPIGTLDHEASLIPQPGDSDLWLDKPGLGEVWDGHTIHTHYQGFCIPEEKIGCFIYVRAQPVFNICGAGVSIFQGMDNKHILDIEHNDYILTCPYPEIKEGNVMQAGPLKFTFIEPGKKFRIEYTSKDGKTSFDLVQTAVSPLMPRGFVMPGEELHGSPNQRPGGSEQSMHCVGDLLLNGKPYKIDCYAPRDRSWRQVRKEDEITHSPPFCWSPMCFSKDGVAELCFNQVGVEDPNQNPIWEGVFAFPKDKPCHHFGWIVVDGEPRTLKTVKRHVLKYHPTLHAATEQEMVVVDSKDQVYTFKGHAIAMAHLPSWPNNMFVDSVYEWTDEKGRKCYNTYQETWYARYQRFREGKLEQKPRV